jgi:hypothetical protein
MLVHICYLPLRRYYGWSSSLRYPTFYTRIEVLLCSALLDWFATRTATMTLTLPPWDGRGPCLSNYLPTLHTNVPTTYNFSISILNENYIAFVRYKHL